ncbi:hypothetical protein B0X71_19685 (plasmid) [Planococcus lenghuensis]|uniref:DUF3990 domain-containing protein n=1 Tax=Planococcus lenghuensis TaxID=2213202 RepID=A0A1Q2L4Q0_9BACL|nr:hypothetical protein B0X71_19685 [Planococcus lenghuensis]
MRNLEKTKWYHGTTLSGFKSIMKQGVKFDVSVGSELDFGPGFYLAPDKEMAEGLVFRQESGHCFLNLFSWTGYRASLGRTAGVIGS